MGMELTDSAFEGLRSVFGIRTKVAGSDGQTGYLIRFQAFPDSKRSFYIKDALSDSSSTP